MIAIILKIALAISPYFLKYGLFLIDKFITDQGEKEAAKKQVIKSAQDYNNSAAEIYNARQEFINHMEEYLALVKAQQQAKLDVPAEPISPQEKEKV